MARRRRDPEEGPRGFDFPEFDEHEFIRKETISFRSALVLLAWSVVAAAVAFAAWWAIDSPKTGWYLGLLIAAGMGYLLRWILPLLKVDIAHFGKKDWFGTGALFFFSWLAFFILILNPPVYDGVAPDLEIHVTPSAQELGGEVNITLIATDNVAVDTGSIDFVLIGPDGSEQATTEDLWLAVDDPSGVWSWGFTPQEAGTYRVEATVKDTSQGTLMGGVHSIESEQEFVVGDVIGVTMSGMGEDGVGRLTSTRDAVTVHLPPEMDVYRAWLEVTRADNTTVPVHLAHDEERSDEERQEWFAQPSFDGFQEGENRFQVHVEEHSTYFLEKRFAGLGAMSAPLVSDESYTVVIDGALLGDEVPDLPDERNPEVVPIPGPAPLVAVTLLLVAVTWLRRRPTGRDQSVSLSEP